MAGVKPLRKIQLGREGTKGTAVAATTVWRGMGTIQDDREVVHIDEDIGYLSGVNRTNTPRLAGSINFESVPATFEQLPHILEAGVRTDTPAADGTGSGYIYEYDFPTTAANTIKTYTIEGGDNTEAEELEYGFVTDFVLSGEGGQSWMMSANWVGRQVSTSTFTSSTAATLPTVEEMNFGKSKLYIDASGGTIGSTQKTSTFLAASFNVDTGLRPVFTGDGNLYFTFDKCIGPQITLDITFEHDGTATAEKDAWRAETGRLIRIKVEGSALTTAGSYTYKTFILDIAGKWETFDKIGERDGNDIVTGRLVGSYSSTDSLFCELTVVNELATIP